MDYGCPPDNIDYYERENDRLRRDLKNLEKENANLKFVNNELFEIVKKLERGESVKECSE